MCFQCSKVPHGFLLYVVSPTVSLEHKGTNFFCESIWNVLNNSTLKLH